MIAAPIVKHCESISKCSHISIRSDRGACTRDCAPRNYPGFAGTIRPFSAGACPSGSMSFSTRHRGLVLQADNGLPAVGLLQERETAVRTPPRLPCDPGQLSRFFTVRFRPPRAHLATPWIFLKPSRWHVRCMFERNGSSRPARFLLQCAGPDSRVRACQASGARIRGSAPRSPTGRTLVEALRIG